MFIETMAALNNTLQRLNVSSQGVNDSNHDLKDSNKSLGAEVHDLAHLVTHGFMEIKEAIQVLSSQLNRLNNEIGLNTKEIAQSRLRMIIESNSMDNLATAVHTLQIQEPSQKAAQIFLQSMLKSFSHAAETVLLNFVSGPSASSEEELFAQAEKKKLLYTCVDMSHAISESLVPETSEEKVQDGGHIEGNGLEASSEFYYYCF